MTEDAVVYKGIHNWEIRMYRAMWARCKQFWKAPDYIRVTDDEGSPQFIGINQPQMGQQIGMDPQTGCRRFSKWFWATTTASPSSTWTLFST
jgi:hypothetical protein